MYNWPIITGARRAKTMKHDYQMLDRDAGKLMCSRREELFFAMLAMIGILHQWSSSTWRESTSKYVRGKIFPNNIFSS